MFCKAKYENDPCYLNMDFVVDIFPNHDIQQTYTAYTYDNERRGYTIKKDEIDKMLEFTNSDVQKCMMIEQNAVKGGEE